MIIANIEHAKRVFDRLFQNPDVTIDTETEAAPGFSQKKDALAYGRAVIRIWSICHRGEAYSCPTNFYGSQYPLMEEYAELLIPYAKSGAMTKVFHNANYDLNVFKTSTPVKVWNRFYDTMIGAWACNTAVGKGLKERALLYGRVLGSLKLSNSMKSKGFAAVDMGVLSSVSAYAEEDVISTDELYQMQMFGKVVRPKSITHIDPKGRKVVTPNAHYLPPNGEIVVAGEGPLTKFSRCWVFYHELPYLKAVLRAEKTGFPFDRKHMHSIRKKCQTDLDTAVKKLYKAAGKKINLNSTPQIVEHIFAPHGIECPFRTEKGKVSLNADALIRMRDSHPLVATLEKYRKVSKLYSTYIGKSDNEGLAYFVAKDNRIHPVINTIGAITGRNSCDNPNLTNIPSRADVYGIKDCFVPPKGFKLICLDYEQLELRIMAILSKDPAMTKILCDPDGDIHQNTADKFGVKRSPTAKQLNFLLLYGGGAYMLSEKLTSEGVPTSKTEAKVYIDRYDVVYHRVSEYRKELLQEHQNNNCVRLLTGRTRTLGEIDWESDREVHKAETTLANNVVQGSGQDMLKAAIIRCDPKALNMDKILPLRIKMPHQHKLLLSDYARKIEKIRKQLELAKTVWALQVHDEAIFFAEDKAAEDVGNMIAEVMTWQHFFPAITDYSVPLAVGGGVGYSWKNAKGDEPLAKLHHDGV